MAGPFKRISIWFQGCNILCKNCCNPDYQSFEPRNILTIDELIKIIIDAKEKFNIEGVTYSGGEPTLQIFLPILTKRIKELGLGVISFTGFLYEKVKKQLEGCDIVIDGAYNDNLREKKRKLVGSTNQRIILLTDRYKDNTDWYYHNGIKEVEINISDEIFINGSKI